MFAQHVNNFSVLTAYLLFNINIMPLVIIYHLYLLLLWFIPFHLKCHKILKMHINCINVDSINIVLAALPC